MAGLSIPAGRFILGGDSPWAELAPHVAIAQHASAWADYAAFGEDDAFNRPILPIAAFDDAVEALGLSPLAVNHLWLILLLVVQAAAATRLFLELFSSPRANLTAALFVASAAILNPLILLAFHTPYPALDLGIAAAPGMLAALLAYLRRGGSASLAEFGAWAALTVPSNMNPAYVIEYAALMSCVCAFAFAAQRNGRRIAVRVSVAALLYIGLNAPFWVPIFHYAATAYGGLVSAGGAYTAGTLAATSAFSQIENVVRLVGGYLFFNPVGGRLYVPDGPAYVTNPLLIVASLALPLLAWMSVLLVRRRDDRAAVFALTALAFVTLFLAKGVAPPFGDVFAWLFAHVPLFTAFREPFDKFGWVLLLCYALLAGATLTELQRRFPRFAVPVTITAFALLAGAAYPILSGRLFWAQAAVMPPHRYELLARWEERQAHDTRILELPVASVLFDAYDWGYVGAGFNANLTSRAIVSREYDFVQGTTLALENALQHYRTGMGRAHIASLAALFGINDIVADTAMNPDYYAPASDPAPSSLPGAPRVASYGSLSVFHVDGANARVYAPARLFTGVATVGEAAALCALTSCARTALVPSLPPAFAARAGTVAVESSAASDAPGLVPRRIVTFASQRIASAGIARFCASQGTVASRDVRMARLPGGAPLALRLRYRSTGDAWLSVGDTRKNGAFSVELPAARAGIAERIFRLPTASSLDTTLILDAGRRTRCINARVNIAAIRSQVRLLGSAADFFLTQPVVAGTAGILNATNARERAFWSPVTVLTGSSQDVTSAPGDRSLGVATRNAQADAYAYFDRVVPGGTYDVEVPSVRWRGSAPQIAVLAQDGEMLANRTLGALDLRRRFVQLRVDNPSGSGRLQLYLYAGSAMPGRSEIVAGPPVVRAARHRHVVVVRNGGGEPAPASLRYRRIDAATYALRVTRAPAQYVLVLGETFSPGWALVGPAGVSATHVVANLGMNAWLVSGSGTYDLTLRYDGEAFIVYGLLAAVLAIAAATGLHMSARGHV